MKVRLGVTSNLNPNLLDR